MHTYSLYREKLTTFERNIQNTKEMATIPRQTGQSSEVQILLEISKQLDKLIKLVGANIPTTTTTTTL